MLVISRVKNESIVIADVVEVTIIEIRGDKVRLGITSPKEMPVHRKEVYDAIRRMDPDSFPDVAASHAPVEPPARPVELTSTAVAPPAPTLDSAIDLLIRASSARLSPEEAAAAKLLLEAVRTKLK